MTITRTKLAKLLYLADLRAVEDGAEPPSGVEWMWLDYGPYNNCLMRLGNELEELGVVVREEYFWGWQLELVGEFEPPFELTADDLSYIEEIVAELGNLSAVTLKDKSYQTSPMLAAQEGGVRGVKLDLSLVQRPVPKLANAARRMADVLRSLPEQEDDAGAVDDLVEEIAEFRHRRQRANAMLLGDD